ncbi:MAG: hypothetical protein A2X18_07550 [Bacteroidetes bacterium GWF2_40_14]|nr:MAG: hypothetical protein A2X18_07550 [Bacteroidetes bacterium GWF2_40_14]
MSANSGYLVEYINKYDVLQKGIIRHKDQYKEIREKNKVLVELYDDEFNQKKDASCNPVKVLKSTETLKVIGFID